MSAVPEQAGKVATMESLRRPAAPEASLPVVRMGFNDLQGFALLQRAANALAASTLVPKEYQNNMPNCLIALEMAQRIGASPLMVMQNLYIVHGRPGWSSKFLIASFNQCGRFTAARFAWSGEPNTDAWTCKAWATEKSTVDRIEGPKISIALAKKEGWYQKSGSKWQTIPELMLMYRAAGWMINTHAPEISMGINTVEELSDVFDASPGQDGQYRVTTEDLRVTSAPAGEAKQPEGEPKPPVADTVDGRTVIDYIAALDEYGTETDVSDYAEKRVPEAVRVDERFAKAVKERLAAIKEKNKKK